MTDQTPDPSLPPKLDITISWAIDEQPVEKPSELDGTTRHTMAVLALEELSNMLHIEMTTLANVVNVRAESFRAAMYQRLLERLTHVEALVGQMLQAVPPPQVTPEGLVLPPGVQHPEAV